MREERLGILFGIGAYVIWGILPIYWNIAEDIPAWEVLAHRILWSFVYMIIFIVLIKRWELFIKECRYIFTHWKKWVSVLAASVVISLNWVVYIWAVQSGLVLEASLGYYINPLVNVVFGLLFLQERFTKLQWIAILLAGMGVLYMTISLGTIPWVALVLAITFGTYGLIKKVADLNPIYALAIETMFLVPVSLIYISTIQFSGTGSFQLNSDGLILAFSGLITVVPLLLFAEGTKRIPLSLIGFIQYIAPTLMLVISVSLLEETFTLTHAITFTFIWIGLILYTFDRYKKPRLKETT